MPCPNSYEKLKHPGLPSSLSDYAYLTRCALAGRSAFLYAVREQKIGVLYIGQTRGPYGAMGRLAQHLSWDMDSNTFRRRVLTVFNLDEIEFQDIEILAVPFPDEPKYQDDARDYREAVESLVHDHVRTFLTRLNSSARLCLVSRAYRHPYRKDAEVIALAKRIGREICEWIS